MAQGGLRAVFQPLQTLAFGSIATTYTIIGTAFTIPVRVVSIRNLTDKTLFFSYLPGVGPTNTFTDHDVVPSMGGVVYDISASSGSTDRIPFLPARGAIYVRYAAGQQPTLGAVYVVAFSCIGD